MQDLPLNALRAFAAVYETGGLRTAARKTGVGHASLARQVRELEKRLGIALIDPDRPGRTLAFTPYGHALGDRVRHALEELSSAVREVEERHLGNAILVDTSPSFAVRWLLPRLATFESAVPWVRVSLNVDESRGAPVARGADIVLRMGPVPGERRGRPFMDDELLPVMSPEYWRRNGRPALANDLKAQRLLHDRDPQATWQHWAAETGTELSDIRGGARFTSADVLLQAAERGFGVALARKRFVDDSLYSGRLVAPIEGGAIPLPDAYWILVAEGPRERSAVRAFRDWILAEPSGDSAPQHG